MGTGSPRIAQLVTGVGVIPRAVLTRELGLFQEHPPTRPAPGLPTGPAESGSLGRSPGLHIREHEQRGLVDSLSGDLRGAQRWARARTGPQASCLSGAEGLSSGRAGTTLLKPWAGVGRGELTKPCGSLGVFVRSSSRRAFPAPSLATGGVGGATLVIRADRHHHPCTL